MFDEAARALAPEQASAASSFLGAFTILLREGVEALLIVIAMIAFLRKAERQDVLAYVHGGWITALVAGGLTWAAATYLISISGASRELTEGFGSLVSAVVLISVGVWMHGKAQAGAWQAYIRDKLSAALSKRSAWFLFLLAFIVVYREVFETILFYAALWSQGGQLAMLSGAALAVASLAVIAWALLTYSKRLPVAQFFSYSSILIAVLAVVLTGKGVAGLQEAGMLDVRPLAALPRIEVLGVFPTWEGLMAQLLTLTAVVVGFWAAGRRAQAAARLRVDP
ncbi:FTR1 family iron permease [Phenylobacterium conjunctum]|uniref:FTR1 family protein n=1 Tax=Phenylobacterium conjunctum TaxID=1298959 RepID=A0ABW3T1L2_9CAUL